MSSRSLYDLHSRVREMAAEHIDACKKEGIDLLITCTLRSGAEQADLYAQGRSKPGKIVTNAQPGQSAHQYGIAYDCVPVVNGKCVWGTAGADAALWERVGKLGEFCGLEWAGRWTSFKEFPHFQYTGGHPISFFASGGKL
jgi:peptidoglycan L-alanyl-D-glutamate endopeptidase CwlK